MNPTNLPLFPEEENFPNLPGKREKDLSLFTKDPTAYEDYVKTYFKLKDTQDNLLARIASSYLVAASWGFLATGVKGLPAITRCLEMKDPWIQEHIGYACNQIVRQKGFAQQFAALIRTNPDYAKEIQVERVIEKLPSRLRDAVVHEINIH